MEHTKAPEPKLFQSEEETGSLGEEEADRLDEGSEDENQEFFDAPEPAPGSAAFLPSPFPEQQTCEQETADPAYLDSVFGELPPQLRVKADPTFTRPPGPKRRAKVKHLTLFPNAELFMGDDDPDLNDHVKILHNKGQEEKPQKHYLHIGGLPAQVLPVPAAGGPFSKEESHCP